MSLKNGTYTITTLMDDLPVGAEPVHSSGPKRVLILPPHDKHAPWAHWKITKKDGNNVYELSVNDATAIRAGDNVLAVPEDFDGEENKWVIEQQEAHGDDIYTQVLYSDFKFREYADLPSSITLRRGRGEGWFIRSADPFTQVNVQPLIVAPSFPPRYVPNEIFKIVSVDE